MPKVKRKCKNCGKEFEVCRSFYANDGEFRWQNVACSPECGAAYLAAVLKSRGIVDTPAEDHEGKKSMKGRRKTKKSEGEQPDTEI